MKTHRTIRYRLHPCTQTKARKLHALAGVCRFVWNHFVGVLRDEYVAYGKCDPSFYSIGPASSISESNSRGCRTIPVPSCACH